MNWSIAWSWFASSGASWSGWETLLSPEEKYYDEKSVDDEFDFCGMPIPQYLALNLLGSMSPDGQMFYVVQKIYLLEKNWLYNVSNLFDIFIIKQK
jgi:hypothetical protein